MRPHTSTTDLDPLDRIDKSIEINAGAEKVFALVSRPGWWINEGTIDPDPDLSREGEVTVLTHAEYGEFRLETVACDPPTYVAFRWHHPVRRDGSQRCSTLVEFRIAVRDGGVTLSVAESGFAQGQKPRAEWLQDRTDNVEGWDIELAAARSLLHAA